MSSSFQCLFNVLLKAFIEDAFAMLSGCLFQYLAILTECEFFPYRCIEPLMQNVVAIYSCAGSYARI
jgi:hypothetical protein